MSVRTGSESVYASSAIGGLLPSRVTCGISSVASANPSISTRSGFTASRYRRRCHAPAGDRCRTPKTLTRQGFVMGGVDATKGNTEGRPRKGGRSVVLFRARRVERPPLGAALFQHV